MTIHSQTAQLPGGTLSRVLTTHWPEYLIEATALGAFLFSACVFGVLLEHPASLIHESLVDFPFLRRILLGLAMGLTAIGIITSPWGQRSGAHMNPAVTLTFLMLKKIAPWDAFFYVSFQFAGSIAGVLLSSLVIGPALKHSSVDYAATVPGPEGPGVAFVAEFTISLIMMATILWVSNSAKLSRYTPFFAGALITVFIIIEAPLSGMSINPARTLGSALSANEWTALWIFFVAPITGMMLAAALYGLRRGFDQVFCAKLNHCNDQPCIFACRFRDLDAL